MSFYATIEDLQAHLGQQAGVDPGAYEQLTDRIAAAAGNSTVAQESLESAEACIDGYLAVKYAVPVDVSNARVAALLRTMTLDIAAFRLMATSPFMEDVLARVEKLHDNQIKFLQGIRDGKTTIPGLAALAPATIDGPRIVTGGNARVFTEESLSRF